MEDQPVRPKVQVPEREATQLAARLRHHLEGVGLSVYGYVNRDGIRALHVAVDHRDEDKVTHRYDIRYKADTDVGILERNALKRIRSHFNLG